MKHLLIVLITLTLIGCQSATSTPDAPTATATLPPTVTVTLPPPDFGDAPHLEGIVFGETKHPLSVLREHYEVTTMGSSQYKVGELEWVLFDYENGTVNQVWFSPPDYTLGDLISDLGEPTIIEMFGYGESEPPFAPQKVLHYPYLGISYRSGCMQIDRYNLEECAINYREDAITSAFQYAPMTVELLLETEDLSRMVEAGHSKIIEWAGFADE